MIWPRDGQRTAYGVRDYRYTVVNDRTVLHPRTHRVIQIVE